MNNDILQKSLSHYNFIGAKKKAEQEQEDYPSYMPELPKYKKSPKIKWSVGAYNMVRQFLP